MYDKCVHSYKKDRISDGLDVHGQTFGIHVLTRR